MTGFSLSIVLPNYNHAEFLSHAIDGILSQRRLPDEIILIDDGSTDDSARLIADLAHKHQRIRPIFFQDNQGAVVRMNHGLSLARGTYVCFCAADDRIEPELFDVAVSKLEEHPRAGLFSAEIRLTLPSGQEIGVRPIVRPSQSGKFFPPDAVRKLLRRNDQFIATPTAVFRREQLVAGRGFPEALGSMADTICARELALRYGFYFEPSVLAEHRLSSQGLSRSTTRNSDAVLGLVSRGRALIETNPLYPAGYASVFERRMRFAVSRIALAETSDPTSLVLDVGGVTTWDRRILQMCLRRTGRLRKLAALTWLTLRLRPYSTIQLLTTAAHRALGKLFRRLRATMLRKNHGSCRPA